MIVDYSSQVYFGTPAEECETIFFIMNSFFSAFTWDRDKKQ